MYVCVCVVFLSLYVFVFCMQCVYVCVSSVRIKLHITECVEVEFALIWFLFTYKIILFTVCRNNYYFIVLYILDINSIIYIFIHLLTAVFRYMNVLENYLHNNNKT